MVAGRDAEDAVRRFFRFVRSGRLDDLVQLFAHNAWVLYDRQDMESFLKAARSTTATCSTSWKSKRPLAAG